MKVKNAIDILQKQKAKIDDPKHVNDDNWVFQTASYIKEFFGIESTEYSFIRQFHFYVKSTNWDSSDDINRWLAEKQIQAKKFLDNCIETLQHKGLVKQPKQNFLNRLSDTAIWSIVSITIPGLISLGAFFGNMFSDKQNIELRQENKLLKDSLTLLRPNINDIVNKGTQPISKDSTQIKQ